ncbi:hypothetical protein PoB_004217600 [Plakobranchus ocellatus]|uniref:Uncharacterized protein n=1 Tax=Plakobranchus ocellatus TaxID=259542 RepID=A0AAV4AX36_9GAST|nr:hypothetical protein PoB_004217600 [Plakobranchus ocellatus]
MSKDGDPQWSRHITQVLLPLLCAAFVIIILTVLACCLTRRNTRAKGNRNATVYSLESSNDTADVGIYDVIDEVLAESKKNIFRSCRRNRLECLLVAQDNVKQKQKISALHASYKPFWTPKNHGPPPSTSGPGQLGISAEPLTNDKEQIVKDRDKEFTVLETDCSGKSVVEDEKINSDENISFRNDQDGDYETLDRYWKLKTSDNKNIVDDSATLTNSETSSVNYKESYSGLISNAQVVRQTYSMATSEHFSKDRGDFNQVLCQLSLLCPAADGKDATSKSDNVCFYCIEGISGDKEYILNVLRNSRLLVVPQCKENSDILETSPVGIVLSPIMTTAGGVKSLPLPPISLTHTTFGHQTGKHGPHGPASNGLKRSNSFQVRGKPMRENTIQTQARARASIKHPNGLNAKCSPNITTDGFVAQILSKLGPLPPLPPGESEKQKTQALDEHHNCVTPVNYSTPFKPNRLIIAPLSQHRSTSGRNDDKYSKTDHSTPGEDRCGSAVPHPRNSSGYISSLGSRMAYSESQMADNYLQDNLPDNVRNESVVKEISGQCVLDSKDRNVILIDDDHLVTEESSDGIIEADDIYFELEDGAAFLDESDDSWSFSSYC